MFGKQLSFEERDRLGQELIPLGWEALDEGDTAKALHIAKRLRKLKNSGAYEIEARARWQQGRRAQAIRVLEQGTERYPQVALLWSYLGEFYSTSRFYDAAIEAFENSARGHGANRPLADYNIALVLWRKQAFEGALLKLNLVPLDAERPPRWRVEELRAAILVDLDRPAEALETIDEALGLLPADGEDDARARCLAVRADANVKLGNRDLGLAEAWQAIGFQKNEVRAARVIRDFNPLGSPEAKMWRLLIKGKWSCPLEEGGAIPEFFASYWVVAETAEEALEYARAFEPEAIRSSLTLNEAKVERPAPGERLGVHEAKGGYTFFAAKG